MLTQMKGIGPVTCNMFLKLCGGIKGCFELKDDELTCAGRKAMIGERKIITLLEQRTNKDLVIRAEKIFRASETSGIHIIIKEDPAYPDRYRNIGEMPAVLYIKGELRINNYPSSIGIVGARRCTAEGKNIAIETAKAAVDEHTAVVSGMAKGIDSYAHTAIIKNGGYTIAVLGNGADICYPKEHFGLYEQIAEHGCVLSEYPPGTVPQEYNFPKRNRLIAALSDTLYVIDAGRNSGTVSTVESSRKYGRQVVRLKTN